MSTISNQTKDSKSTQANDPVLNEGDLTDEAKQGFIYHTRALDAFESYCQSILRNKYITSTGRNFFLSLFQNYHTNFKRVLNYAANHNKFLDQDLPIIGPLVISGPPRTGTTLLYNLLACDPHCRAPLYTDMCIDVVPPIPRSDFNGQKRRIDIANSSRQGDGEFSDLLSRIASSHARFAIEEDYEILRQAGYFPFFTILSDNEDSNPESWICNEISKDYVYDYHEMFLRMLSTVDKPKSHWLLKSPLHVFNLDKLFRHYPNALLIVTHRRITEVLPSLCSLSMSGAEGYFDKMHSITRDRIIKRCCQYIDTTVQCLMKFLTSQNNPVSQSKQKIFHINYEELIKNPIDVVHKIYDYFSLSWSSEIETGVRSWLLQNPSGKQGRHMYSLAEFGLNRDEIEARYAGYHKLFLTSASSND